MVRASRKTRVEGVLAGERANYNFTSITENLHHFSLTLVSQADKAETARLQVTYSTSFVSAFVSVRNEELA